MGRVPTEGPAGVFAARGGRVGPAVGPFVPFRFGKRIPGRPVPSERACALQVLEVSLSERKRTRGSGLRRSRIARDLLRETQRWSIQRRGAQGDGRECDVLDRRLPTSFLGVSGLAGPPKRGTPLVVYIISIAPGPRRLPTSAVGLDER